MEVRYGKLCSFFIYIYRRGKESHLTPKIYFGHSFSFIKKTTFTLEQMKAYTRNKRELAQKTTAG